jgi:hypothetical protein
VQVIVAPAARLATVALGVQLTVAPLGNPLMLQVALTATLGPLLVQVISPLTLCPPVILVGKVFSVTAISASVIVTGEVVPLQLAG